MKDGSISDVEFDLILREIERYFSIKNQLERKAREVDVEATKKKTRITRRHNEIRFEFEKTSNGFCLPANHTTYANST